MCLNFQLELELGELQPAYLKLYGVYLTRQRQNSDIAPRPAETGGGADLWNAATSARDITDLAQDTVTGAALSINLDTVYGNYESVRCSPAATLPRATHDSTFKQLLKHLSSARSH